MELNLKILKVTKELRDYFLKRRLKGNIILTTEEKCKNFIRLYSNIVQRVPQHNIASFLGHYSGIAEQGEETDGGAMSLFNSYP